MAGPELPDLGVGVVFVPGLEGFLRTEPGLATVVEVEPQVFWFETGDPEHPYRVDPEAIALLLSLPQPKIVHGVGFPVGGSRPPDPRHLPPFVRVIRELGAPWASEHLSFNQAAGPRGPFATGFLLPPRQTREGASAAARSIGRVAPHLPVPFLVETGANYLRPRADEVPDGEFVASVVEAADCGILLDLHNLWANERNGRQPVEEFLGELPLERVWEVHLAGGLEFEGYWVDAHSGAVPEPLMELAARVIPRLPNLHAIILEIFPPFLPRLGIEGLASQLRSLQGLWRLRRNGSGSLRDERSLRRRGIPEGNRPCSDRSPRAWEDALGHLVTGRAPPSEVPQDLAADPGVGIFSRLAREFRAGAIAEALPLASRLLFASRGEAGFRRLLSEFWEETPPSLFAGTEAERFLAYLERRGAPIPPEVLAVEQESLRAAKRGSPEPSGLVPIENLSTRLLPGETLRKLRPSMQPLDG